MATKKTKTTAYSNVTYNPASPIGKLFARLIAAKGKPVEKATLYRNLGTNAPKLLAWILIHGRTTGRWNVTYPNGGTSAALALTKKGAAGMTKKNVAA